MVRRCCVCGRDVYRARFRAPENRTTCNLPSPCRNQLVSRIRPPNWNNMRGEGNVSWNGGITTHHGYTYIRCLSHPAEDNHGYVMMARLVLEQKLGRFLTDNEVAHHINEIRSDDSPENLELMTTRQHRQHHTMGNKNPNRKKHL